MSTTNKVIAGAAAVGSILWASDELETAGKLILAASVAGFTYGGGRFGEYVGLKAAQSEFVGYNFVAAALDRLTVKTRAKMVGAFFAASAAGHIGGAALGYSVGDALTSKPEPEKPEQAVSLSALPERNTVTVGGVKHHLTFA